MIWIVLLFLALGIATVFFLNQSSQKTVTVAKEHSLPTDDGEITAIEYFWRPG